MDQSLPSGRSFGTLAITGLGVAGVLLLGALIVRELSPHHATARGARVHTADDEVPTAPASAPVAPLATPAAARRAVAPPSPPAREAPAAARTLASLVADPSAFAPTSVWSPPVATTETYNFESLAIFNSGSLQRSKANPAAWTLDALRGPSIAELGPDGAVREAAVVKDAKGTLIGTWYAIDSGPLAPAFVTQQGPSMRVLSRAYVEANRAEFPREITSLLDR